MAETNVREFTIALDRIAKNLPEKSYKKFRDAIGLYALRGIVLRNPVGNPTTWESLKRKDGTRRDPPAGYVGGQSRGNWFVDVVTINARISNSPDRSGAKTISRGTVKINTAPVFSDIFIHNSMPYIMRLENGRWSNQARNGMVAVTVASIQVRFSNFRI